MWAKSLEHILAYSDKVKLVGQGYLDFEKLKIV
jgi:hypothetical protein